MFRPLFLLALFCTLTCDFAGAAEPGRTLDFRELQTDIGMQVERSFNGAPDQDGVLRLYVVELPSILDAVYYSPNDNQGTERIKRDNWPSAGNKTQPRLLKDLGRAGAGGLFLLLKLADGRFLALLPVCGDRTLAWFTSSNGRFAVNLGTLGTGRVTGDLPVMAWARSQDPYEACRLVWETALRHPLVQQSTRLRQGKSYPEIFRYLGWCTWEEYRSDITEQSLLDSVNGIEASELPIRWFLVDNGHLDERDRLLLSFHPNSKFPNGWERFLSRRAPDKIRWMGLWLNFNGYWAGIHPNNTLGALNEHLERVSGGNRAAKGGTLQPRLGFDHSFAFYDAMIGAARQAGFDFVKVDNQAVNLELYRGSEQPVQAAVENSRALEAAAALHMDGLMNCMAHNIANVFNTRISAVTRSSEDYLHGDLPRAKRHLHNSYGNMPWLGQTVWGDYDMFHSEDSVGGRILAVSKAMSGGPVYLSDNPRRFIRTDIIPLCYGDGELLRPLAPAAPLPESLFLDPFAGGQAFRVTAPLENESAAIVVYNLTDPEVPVTGYVTQEDYPQATVMMQPRRTWRMPSEGLIIYDWYARRSEFLRKKYAFRLERFSDRLLLLCPVRNGWAMIGRTDKFLSPAAVKVLRSSPSELLFQAREAGPIAIWQADKNATLHSDDCALRKITPNLWEAALLKSAQNLAVRIHR